MNISYLPNHRHGSLCYQCLSRRKRIDQPIWTFIPNRHKLAILFNRNDRLVIIAFFRNSILQSFKCNKVISRDEIGKSYGFEYSLQGYTAINQLSINPRTVVISFWGSNNSCSLLNWCFCPMVECRVLMPRKIENEHNESIKQKVFSF